ncbi:transcriptional regulator [Neorhizobium lilium]|uniref:Transcriptional regulator n=1 Tax=Neorhizobium lilium TaxID=2503024 RepID=A0A3S3TZN5_9HYPH|nr:ChrR family anti-sigma-E factor [Neorhizobium lilium]RWX78552.1 transcriptional regulator [Neorhizobium lilium]
MKINHHLSDELLLDYAAGNLTEGWSLVMATHMALCPSCRRRLSAMEGAAGALLEKVEPHDVPEDSWARMKQRLEGIRIEEVKPKPAAPQKDALVFPEPLRSYVGADLADVKWQALGLGAYHLRIETADPTTQVRLLRIPAGKPVPEHTHVGKELTLVLSGSFYDGDELFGRGDVEEADDSLLHTPKASPGEDCVCLAVTEAPLKFSSWIVRLIQPILKI